MLSITINLCQRKRFHSGIDRRDYLKAEFLQIPSCCIMLQAKEGKIQARKELRLFFAEMILDAFDQN